jgi:hypothetical protein
MVKPNPERWNKRMKRKKGTTKVQHNSSFQRFQACASAALALPEIFDVSEIDAALYGRKKARVLFKKACKQVVEGCGETCEDPLLGLGIDGFYVMSRGLGHDVIAQSAQFFDSHVIDRMTLVGNDINGDYETTIYNLVKKDE